MNTQDTHEVAIPVLTDSLGRYLLITRTEYPEHKGEWGPIAGHVKVGETIEQALIRESLEELNLSVKPIKQIARIDQDIAGDVGMWWACDILGGDISTNEEIEKVGFFNKDEVRQLKLWPATRRFFEEFVWKDA